MSDSELQFTYAHHFQHSCPELVEFLIFLLTDKMNANKLTFSQINLKVHVNCFLFFIHFSSLEIRFKRIQQHVCAVLHSLAKKKIVRVHHTMSQLCQMKHLTGQQTLQNIRHFV